ncbi:MAG TPA: DUF5681 domain-containing protein [Methylibium sp.]|uniref:DUF5681 domain-containing protein n=1 Tax=Methylibium sp. TaxID=2067992 RepID=UPI002DBF0070|nr:DUF5681 domain-containing protein [Methylibium sp.]HEU4459746.1 DUF5681 domain-containing protein [Methylibium sp.]
MADPNDDYQVGYGKPPKHSQFPQGVSGNPRGRPRKLRATGQTEIEQIFTETCGTLIDGGKARPIGGQEALFLALIKKAMTSVAAAAALFKLERELMMRELDAATSKRARSRGAHEPRSRGGFLLVPAILEADEWEAIARPMQKKLMEEARL